MTTKRSPGRPKLSAGESLDVVIKIRIREAERERIQSAAVQRGTTVSVLVREAVLGSLQTKAPRLVLAHQPRHKHAREATTSREDSLAVRTGRTNTVINSGPYCGFQQPSLQYSQMANNEKTSKKVASKASKILSNPKSTKAQKSVAASALTQAPDKKKKRK